MKKRGKFPKELLCDEINESNRRWLDEYKAEAELKTGYYQKIENFFRFRDYQNKPFNTFTVSDVEKYLGVMVDSDYAANTINTIPRALSGFKKFLISKHSSLFSKDFLADLPSSYFDKSNGSDFFALSLTQINLIREYNKRNILDEYVFEIYFQLGIDKQDITICHPDNTNEKRSHFIVPNGKDIRYNAKIAGLLEKLPKNNDIRLSAVIADSYLPKVTDYLRQQEPPAYNRERNLNYSDLEKSHKKYIIKCPSCGQLTENISQNWILAKLESDPDLRLACFECRGKFYGN